MMMMMMMLSIIIKDNKKSQSNLEELCRHPLRQRMDSPAACASCV